MSARGRAFAFALALAAFALAAPGRAADAPAVAAPVAGTTDREPPAWLRGHIEAWVLAHLPDEPVHVALPPFSDFAPPGLVPEGVAVQIEAPGDGLLRGRVPLTVTLRRDGRELAQGRVDVIVDVLAERLVAARTLERGEIVTKDDLERRPLEAGERAGTPVEAAALVGKRTRRRVPNGALWREDWVEAVPVVTRGQPVRLRYEQGGLRIDATGIARDDGGVGELVRVQNPASHRELRGRVAADGSVHVAF